MQSYRSILVPLFAAALAVIFSNRVHAQTNPNEIQICTLGSSECRPFDNQKDANDYVASLNEARAKKSRDIEQAMPIDYRDCVVTALLDEMRPDKRQHYFVADLDNALKKKLRVHGVDARPGTAIPKEWIEARNKSTHTPYWSFSFMFAEETKPGEEYKARIGFACGTLCLSSTLYVLRVNGNTCDIVSKSWEGGA